MTEIELPRGFKWDPNLELGEETEALTRLVWPCFLVEESDIPEIAFKFRMSREEIARRMPVWGIRSEQTLQLVAYANANLVEADLSSQNLPDSGWRSVQEAFAKGGTPNSFCLVTANVHPAAQKFGLSGLLLEQAKLIAKNLGLKVMIGPVRPTLKNQFPDISIEEYLNKRTEAGEVFDPWLRLHLRLGGQIVNICHKSVVVKASLEKWRKWTNLSLLEDGDQLIPLGLAPLKVDAGLKTGVYIEPNVWVKYEL